jgi:Flp pilus assembly protein TadD
MSGKRMLAAGLLIAGAVVLQSSHRPSREDSVWQHRNLGKAFYENPTTQKQAVEEFRQALALNPNSFRERLNYGLALVKAGETDAGVRELRAVQTQDPTLPHTWFSLGVAYKTEGDAAAAIAQFQGLLRLAPNEPVSHYNLGVLYRQNGELARAVTEFETAARLDVNFAAPRFQLYSAYRESNRTADSARVLAEFRVLKEKQDQPDAEKEDVSWSVYSEIYDPPAERAPAAAEMPKYRFRVRDLKGTADPATAGVLILDFDGDGRPDALVWSDSGILFYRRGTELVDRGLSLLRHVRSVAAGDYDNDGLTDLCVVTSDGALLFRNDRAKGFSNSRCRPPAWDSAALPGSTTIMIAIST